MTYELLASTAPGREQDRRLVERDAKGKELDWGYWDEKNAGLSVNEKATEAHLAFALASELAPRAKLFQVAFSKKALLAALPAELSALTAVEKVVAWRVLVGASLWTLPKLESADLFDVGAVGPLGHEAPLKSLKVSGARTTELPADLERATRLEQLELRDVGLRSLPEALGTLSALHTLSIVGATKLKKLPASFAGPALRVLTLEDVGTDRTEMPAWIAKLPALERLSLGHVQQPPPAWLAEVSSRVAYSGPRP